jgi:hypothetical protein
VVECSVSEKDSYDDQVGDGEKSGFWEKEKRSVGEEMVWEMESDFSWSEKEN